MGNYSNFTVTEDDPAVDGYTIALLFMLSLFSLIGAVGNLTVLYVFSKKKDQQTSRIFILTLALTDFFTCLITIPYTMIMEYFQYRIDVDILCKIYFFTITSAVPFSALIMVAIAVDRYFCICHPFLFALNAARAKMIILVMAIFALFLGIVPALGFGVYQFKEKTVTHNMPFYEMGSFTNTTIIENDNLELGNATYSVNSTVLELEFTGLCAANQRIVSHEFRGVYQKLYAAVYLLSFIIVLVLYGLIYKFVLFRRGRRLTQRSEKTSMMEEATETIAISGHEAIAMTNDTTEPAENRTSERKIQQLSNRVRMANIKTAMMLFVVALVFLFSFLPAWLMAHRLITFNVIVFYMYFIYNVANPVIYAFMNPSFRGDLGKIIHCTRR